MTEEVFRAVNINVPNDKGHGLVNLSLSIEKGEILGIYGNRYAGRNKLIRLIMGEIVPESGYLFWGNAPSKQDIRIATITRDSVLIDELTIWENMAILWGEKTPGIQKMKKLTAVFLEDYGFEFCLNDSVRSLSQMEKLELEVLMAHQRHTKILLIDGTDIEGMTAEYERLKKLLTRFKQEGMSIVYINYQMAPVSFLADRIAILYQGRILKILDKDQTSQAELEGILSGLYAEEKLEPGKCSASREEILSVKNLNIGLSKSLSLTINRGEFLTVITPRLELFSVLQARIAQGEQAENCSFFYQGIPRKRLHDDKEIFFLNTLYLDRLLEELSPLENLCLGMYEKFSFLGIRRRQMLKCLEQEFYDWYGHEGMLREKNCSALYRKDRIAINLFRLRLLKSKVIICNDLSIHNDFVTYRMVKNCLAKLQERGTAVCMITGDMTYNDEMVQRYLFLDPIYG
ncbi:MAG: ATP-binding cassette domain-containing protein [Eubacteriales bacterium]|nr:ATP-binding cassette domain-containing protein [Eubacteriales bacterium]